MVIFLRQPFLSKIERFESRWKYELEISSALSLQIKLKADLNLLTLTMSKSYLMSEQKMLLIKIY